jgi:hypothetical protein
MKTNLFFALILSIIFFSCKKDQGVEIDYNVLTEKRILEVSEKTPVTDADIAPLERLIEENITNTAVKQRLTEMLNSVKLLKVILPSLSQLRSDENVNFLEKHKEIFDLVSSMSDLIPRKAVLLKELEENKNGYNNEEVLFSTDYAKSMEYYLKENYRITPIPGKDYIAFTRSDIDKVDSIGGGHRILYADLKKFNSLRKISVGDIVTENGEDVNLNKFPRLSRLRVELADSRRLVIDSCRYLKHLSVKGANALTRLDLTNSCDSLQTLSLIDNGTALKSVILPNKKWLEDMRIEGMGNAKAAYLDTLIVEGSGNTLFIQQLDLAEMKLLRLANLGSISIQGRRFIKTGTSQWGDLGYYTTTKIKNLDIANNPSLKSLTLFFVNLPGELDLSSFTDLTGLYIYNCASNATDETYFKLAAKELKGMQALKNLGSLTMNGFAADQDFASAMENLDNLWNVQFEEVSWPQNTSLDLRKLKKIVILGLHSFAGPYEGAYEGPYLKKVILWNGVKNNVGQYGDTFILLNFEDTGTEIEYVN